IGKVEAVVGGAEPRLRFRTARDLQRHDGLQVDLPTLGKPFGFAVDHLWLVGKKGRRDEAFEAKAGSLVEVSLPREHPELPTGAPVYCSSSQAVKQKYRYARPKPGLYRTRRAVAVGVVLTADALKAVATVRGAVPVEVTQTLPRPFQSAPHPP